VEYFKVEEILCAEGVDMRTKREGSVENNAEELGGRVECKWVLVRVS